MTSHADAAFNSIAEGDDSTRTLEGRSVYYQRAQALALLAIWDVLDDILEVLDTGSLRS